MGRSSEMAAVLCMLACIYSLQTVGMGTNSANLSAGVGFWSLVVYDNVIKEGPNSDSKLLGRASGVGVGVIQPSRFTEGLTRVQMQKEHIFEEASMYHGSTISVSGIFYSLKGPWECIVPGATGNFRGYTGYGMADQISETAGPPPVYLVYRWDFYLFK